MNTNLHPWFDFQTYLLQYHHEPEKTSTFLNILYKAAGAVSLKHCSLKPFRDIGEYLQWQFRWSVDVTHKSWCLTLTGNKDMIFQTQQPRLIDFLEKEFNNMVFTKRGFSFHNSYFPFFPENFRRTHHSWGCGYWTITLVTTLPKSLGHVPVFKQIIRFDVWYGSVLAQSVQNWAEKWRLLGSSPCADKTWEVFC